MAKAVRIAALIQIVVDGISVDNLVDWCNEQAKKLSIDGLTPDMYGVVKYVEVTLDDTPIPAEVICISTGRKHHAC